MNRYRPTVQAVLCAAIWILPATANEPDQSVLDRIDQASRSIQDLTCTFEEAKHTALLKKPLVSSGTLKVKKSHTRWHTTRPYESILYTDESSLAIYFPKRSIMEVYPLDRRWRNLAISPIPSVATLTAMFNIKVLAAKTTNASDSVRLRLTPKTDANGKAGNQVAEFIEYAELSVHSDSGMASKFEMVDPEGDRTVITFHQIRTNTGLSDADLLRSVPKDTKVVYPMGKKKNASTNAPRP